MRHRKRALQVTVDVRESSVVELTVNEKVQIDRIKASPRGVIAERHGKLLEVGTTTLTLAPGQFFFKTMSDANLRVVHGGVDVTTNSGSKDPPPPPPPPGVLDPGSRGDDPPGPLPTLTLS